MYTIKILQYSYQNYKVTASIQRGEVREIKVHLGRLHFKMDDVLAAVSDLRTRMERSDREKFEISKADYEVSVK